MGACLPSPAADIPERQDCWHVYFGDVPVGTIARRVGQSHDQDARQWLSGFYTGSDPGEQSGGTAPTFEQARADFGVAWREFSAQRTEAGYQAWRDQRDWTERKYAMWERGERFPSQRVGIVKFVSGIIAADAPDLLI